MIKPRENTPPKTFCVIYACATRACNYGTRDIRHECENVRTHERLCLRIAYSNPADGESIIYRSARLNPRSPSKAGAVDLSYLPPEIYSLPSRHRGSNPAENERHDAAGAAKYIRTLVRGLREATRAGEKSWYTKINIEGEGSDHVAKQSARLRLGTSVNHPADPTTNMQRKKLSSSPRRRVPARIHSRLFSSYATYKQKITRKPSRNTSSVLDMAVSSTKPICFGLSRAWHDHETTRLNRADVYKTNKNYASSSSGYRKERSTTYVSTNISLSQTIARMIIRNNI